MSENEKKEEKNEYKVLNEKEFDNEFNKQVTSVKRMFDLYNKNKKDKKTYDDKEEK